MKHILTATLISIGLSMPAAAATIGPDISDFAEVRVLHKKDLVQYNGTTYVDAGNSNSPSEEVDTWEYLFGDKYGFAAGDVEVWWASDSDSNEAKVPTNTSPTTSFFEFQVTDTGSFEVDDVVGFAFKGGLIDVFFDLGGRTSIDLNEVVSLATFSDYVDADPLAFTHPLVGEDATRAPRNLDPGYSHLVIFGVEGPITPVPLPGSLPLALAGLGFLGVIAWHRKSKAKDRS